MWQLYMRISVKQVADSDIVATLPGWEQSKGAQIEVNLAKQLGELVTSVSALVAVEGVEL